MVQIADTIEELNHHQIPIRNGISFLLLFFSFHLSLSVCVHGGGIQMTYLIDIGNIASTHSKNGRDCTVWNLDLHRAVRAWVPGSQEIVDLNSQPLQNKKSALYIEWWLLPYPVGVA